MDDRKMLRLRRIRTIALVGPVMRCLSMAITNPALAGQPGVSAGNECSDHAVSQYDIACVQASK
jgi:hypothetical protein